MAFSLCSLTPDCTRPVYVAEEHKDEILHVAICPTGPLVATCSKDGSVKFWNQLQPSTCFRSLYFTSSHSSQLHQSAHVFDWLFPQYCEFQPYNQAGDIILISGVKQASQGELVIYNLSMDVFLARAELMPYDVLGCFLDSLHYLSAIVVPNDNASAFSLVCINRIPLLTTDEEVLLDLSELPMQSLLTSYNGPLGTVIRRLMVADGSRQCLFCHPSGIESYSYLSAQQSSYVASRIQCTCKERMIVLNRGYSCYLSHCVSITKINGIRVPWFAAYNKHKIGNFHISEDQLLPGRDPCTCVRYSIYSTTSLHNRVWEVDVGGHVVGMSFSPEHRFLYVNVRPWADPSSAAMKLRSGSAMSAPPELAQQVSVHVIDLVGFRYIGPTFYGHHGYTPSESCFFLFLSVSNYLLASGSEDGYAVLWDRYSGVILGRYKHSDVVNACEFLPSHSSGGVNSLVSVSDDRTMKVWGNQQLDCAGTGNFRLALRPRCRFSFNSNNS